MFQAIIQLMLLGLLFYIVWNTLLIEVKPPKKEEKKPEPQVIIINTDDKKKDDKPPPKPKIVPRAYLAWFGFILLILFIFLSFTTPNSPAIVDFGSILTFPLKPLGLALFLVFLALVGHIKDGALTKDGTRYVRAAFLVLVFFSLPIIAGWLAQQGEYGAFNAAKLAAKRDEPVSAIVLLGHETTQLNLLAPNQVQLTDTSERISATIREYYHQVGLGSRPVVVVSAGSRPAFKYDSKRINLQESKDIARLLVQQGIPRSSILLEPTGIDFRSSALAVETLIQQGLIEKQIILVAPALGMQRARQTFAKLGIETLASPAGFLSFQPGALPRLVTQIVSDECSDVWTITIRSLRELQIADFVPNADSLLTSTRVINEFWTSVYYLLKGWIAPSGAEPVHQESEPAQC